MLSKWKCWDLWANKSVLKPEGSILALQFPNEYIARPFIDSCFVQLNDYTKKVALASEINQNWIDEKLNTFDMFAQKEAYLIFAAEKIQEPLLKELLERSKPQNERILVLYFSQGAKSFGVLSKDPAATCISVSDIPFWESRQLLELFCKTFAVNLSFKVQNYILENVTFTAADYYSCVNRLSTEYGHQIDDDLANIKKVIGTEKFDKFYFAELLSRKKFSLLYQKIYQGSFERSELISLFNFLQSHLLKLADTSYTKVKKKLSKYDKDIQANSRFWNFAEVHKTMRFFSKLEILYKSNSPQATEELRRAAISWN